MSNYPKKYDEINVSSITSNDAVHPGLKWNISYNTTIGEVDFIEPRRYTSIYTDNVPSYWAVLSDNNNEYARIPIYSYTYTETLSIKGKDNVNNYPIMFPIIHEGTSWTSSIKNSYIADKHYTWDNKNYVTTYSKPITFSFDLIKNYKRTNEQVYHYDPLNNHLVNTPMYDIQTVMKYFMYPTEQQIANDPTLENCDGINVNRDVLRIGASYMYLKNGDIYNGNTTTDKEMIAYLWFAYSVPSPFIYEYNSNGLVGKYNINNNYEYTSTNRRINLNETRLGISTHESLTQSDINKIFESTSDVYADHRLTAEHITDIPNGCGGALGSSKYKLLTYVGHRGISNELGSGFAFRTSSSYIFENIDLMLHDSSNWPIFIPSSHIGSMNILNEPIYYNNGLGVVLRSYCYTMEHQYSNYYGKDLTTFLPSTSYSIYPARFYDASETTYLDTKIAAPFYIYRKTAKLFNGIGKIIIPYIVRLNINNGTRSLIDLNSGNIGKIELRFTRERPNFPNAPSNDGNYYDQDCSYTTIKFNKGVDIGSSLLPNGASNYSIPASSSQIIDEEGQIINGYAVTTDYIIIDRPLETAFSKFIKVKLWFDNVNTMFSVRSQGGSSGSNIRATLGKTHVKLYNNTFGNNPTIKLEQKTQLQNSKYNKLYDGTASPFLDIEVSPITIASNEVTSYIPDKPNNQFIHLNEYAVKEYLKNTGISKRSLQNSTQIYKYEDLFYTNFAGELNGTSYLMFDINVSVGVR